MIEKPLQVPPKKKRGRRRKAGNAPHVNKTLDAARQMANVSFAKLINENPEVYQKIISTVTEQEACVYHMGQFHVWNTERGVYDRWSRDRFIDGILMPILTRSKLGMERGHTMSLYHHLTGIVPPTSEARKRVYTEKVAEGFDLVSGRRVSQMAVGKDQLVEITPDYQIRIFGNRDSRYFFTSSMPVTVHPEVVEERPHMWQRFLDDSFPSNTIAQSMLDEIVGAVLYKPDLPNIILTLIGQGGAGKGVLTRMLINLVGEEPHFETSQIVKLSSRFTATAYYDKRLMVISDLPSLQRRTSRMMESLAILKNVTGGDSILLEQKGKDPLSVRPSIVPIVSTNFKNLNWISDAEDARAWLRRILPVHFLHPKNEEDHIQDFETQLVSPEMVRWCLDAYAQAKKRNGGRVNRQMFTRDDESLKLENSLRGTKVNTPEEFLKKYFNFSSDHSIFVLATGVVSLLAADDAVTNAIEPIVAKKVLRRHMGLMPGKGLPKRKNDEGNFVNVYTGIRWRKSLAEREAEALITGIDKLDADSLSFGLEE